MKILFVADVSIAHVIGGAERVLYEQTRRLAERGHAVYLITRRLSEHDKDHEVISGVNEWRYMVPEKVSVNFYFKTIRNSRRLFEHLHEDFDFKYINSHQPFSASGILRSPQCKKIKNIYTCHSLSFEEFKSRNPKPPGRFDRLFYLTNVAIRKRIERKVLRQSEKIITLSRFTKQKLQDIHMISPEKVLIIPGGVDLNKFHPIEDRNLIRRRLNIPEEKIVLLTIRNLVSRMGLENLIDAMKKIVESSTDVYLVVGGEGALKNDLEIQVKKLGLENYIEFSGFIPEEVLPDYYRMADFFILPTRELEGFGLVTLEAMASGLPVLGTPVGGTREIIEPFNSGLLFSDITPEAIALLVKEKCESIKKQPGSWKDLSKKCRRYVEMNFSWGKNIDSMEEVFRL